MTKRSVTLIMIVLLLSYAPVPDYSPTEDNPIVQSLDRTVERVEISPDPNSIQDLGSPLIYSGSEDLRVIRADSSIGVYTLAGLLPSVQMSTELTQPRNDLAIVLVDGEVGLWEARMAILEVGNIEVRSTIPPSGFLVQAPPDDITALSLVEEVEAIHVVPAGLLVHPDLRLANGEQTLLVEVLGWKDSDLNRHDKPGMGFDDTLNIAASLWLQEYWSPEPGRMWGLITSDDVDEIVKHPSVAYVAPMPVLVLHNDQARVNMGINTVESTFIT
ncbi:uncharacterized protein METZ01_LOCUS93732, partial [marine metagenome]